MLPERLSMSLKRAFYYATVISELSQTLLLSILERAVV